MSSSLTNHIDGAYIASEVLLEKDDAPEKACLLVEGKDDKIVFSKFVSEVYCKIIDCNGKKNLIPAIDILNLNNSVDGYLGICDSDFDVLDGIVLQTNLVSTDGHDLEVMILSTKAIDYVIDVRVKGENEVAVKEFKSLIRTILFELGSVIGYLRYISHQQRWGIDVHTHQLLNCMNPEYTLSLVDAINEVKTVDPIFDESKVSISDFENLRSNNTRHLCHGHELIFILGNIFSRLSKKHFGNKINLGHDVSDRIFLAFDLIQFQTTDLFKKILNWENNNAPYKILSA